MKVVHLSTLDYGGAGLAALRIHLSLRTMGIDSTLHVSEKNCSEESVKKEKKATWNSYKLPRNRFLNRLMRFMLRHGPFKTESEKDKKYLRAVAPQNRSLFTSPISSYSLCDHPAIKDADIIHLHWIENFVDYRSFFASINKPVVWTAHDENIGYGGFHYKQIFIRYYPYYKHLEDKYSDIKRKALSRIGDLTMVSLSQEMDDFCHNDSFMKDRTSVIIPNSVDYHKFVIQDKEFARRVIKVPENSIVFVFCAYNIDDPFKGLNVLLEALETLSIPNLVLLCVGKGNVPRRTNIKIYKAGLVINEDFLSLLLSAADLFVLPSCQEAFAQTPLEALCCGVPIVAFPVSGTSYLINEDNGIRCNGFTVNALIEGIQKALETKYDPSKIRQDIINRFSPELIAERYADLYESIITRCLR